VFARKPMFGYKGLVAATLAIAALSMTVWAHHMFATGAVLLPFFSFLSYLIAVPTGIKFFNWIGTLWRGQLTFETPMLFSLGFLATFLFGGLSGVLLAAPPIDWHVSDSYFVVAHFHYVLFGTIVFAAYAGVYFWFPKMTGRMLDERLGKLHFWLTFIGFHTTFLIQHWLGNEGMPRRYADYLPPTGSPPEHDLDDRLVRAGRVVLPFSTTSASRTLRRDRHGRTTRGATATPGVGDVLPAAAAQLHVDPAHRSERPAFEYHTRTWCSGWRGVRTPPEPV
jgi:cytochrome c oxidase subunit 1